MDRSIRASHALCFTAAVLLAAAACENFTYVAGGSVRVVVLSSGGDVDRDGYRLIVDGEAPESVAVSGATVKHGLASGLHELELAGVAPNCTVAGLNPRAVTVALGETVEETFAVTCVATQVRVQTLTSGLDLDPDGYLITVDTLHPIQVGANHIAYVSYLTPGTHDVAITGLAANCSVAAASQNVTLVLGEQKPVTFNVTCVAISGVLRIESATTGIDLDEDDYTITVDGGPPRLLLSSSVLAITGLPVGDHEVRLGGVAANCTLAGANPRTATITGGTTARDTTRLSFTLQCGATTGAIAISATRSGLDLDDTLSIRVDGGTPFKLPTSFDLTLNGMAGGNHALELVGLAGNCSITGANPVTVTVAIGGAVRDTARTSFAVSCVATHGIVEVSSVTTGGDHDLNGYLVQVGAETPRHVVDSAVTRLSVWSGTYGVALGDISPNCATSSNPRQVTVAGGGLTRDTVRTTFNVSCATYTGSIVITTRTAGTDKDPDGYRVRVLGLNYDNSDSLGADDSHAVHRLSAGNYILSLGSLSTNCAVTGPSSAAATIAVGDTARVVFDVSCTPAPELAVVFNSNTGTGNDIIAIKTNGARLGQLTSHQSDDWDPAWSADGSKLAFASSRDGAVHIYVTDPAGSVVTRLTSSAGIHNSPAWSPDGSKIAFTSSAGSTNGNMNIWVMNADGSNPVQLTTHPSHDSDPAWSPDGSKIAFSSARSTGDYDIWVMNADGTNQARLTSGNVDEGQPAWSPDGTKLVYSRLSWCTYYACDYDLMVMNADGTGSLTLNSSTSDLDPAWSPDGQWIAYTASYCDSYYGYCWISGTMAVRPDGSGSTMLFAGAQQPSWRRP